MFSIKIAGSDSPFIAPVGFSLHDQLRELADVRVKGHNKLDMNDKGVQDPPMNENTKLLEIKAIQEAVQKNLELVHKALGIEPTSHHDEVSELEPESERVSDEVSRQLPYKKYNDEEFAEKIAEEKRYLAAQYAETRTRFAQSQARFAEARTKFINRRPSEKSLRN